jgi:hypothetical protein
VIRAALVASVMVVAACGSNSPYTCTASDQCVQNGVNGACEASHFCSFPDSSCPSGRRYEANAGNGLGGTCATGLPPDGPLIDAPVVDAKFFRDARLIDASGPAIKFIQTNGQKNSGGSSQALAFSQTVTAHNTLIVCVDAAIPGSATVTDSLGNNFTAVVGPIADFSVRFWIFAAFDVAGGSDTVTVTLSSAANTVFEIYLHEYAGLLGFDTGGGASGSTTGTDGITTGPIQTHFNNEMIFGFLTSGMANPGTGFTQRSNLDGNVTEDKVVATPGLYAATATMTAGTEWTVLMAAFAGF